MEAELTLKMDSSVVFSAQKYAEQHRRSLSEITESYFRRLAVEDTRKEKYSPEVERLIGVISEEEVKKLAAVDERARYILRIDHE